jgi:outer membrane protein TolC
MRRLAATLLLLVHAPAQEPSLTLRQAVQKALERYPSIRLSQRQADEAAAAVNLARTAFLPRVDGHAQVNRATANNVFGLLFPNTVIPPISGPQIDGDQSRNVFGAAIGVLAAWEPFDFGRRQADVDAASASQARAGAAIERTRLDVAAATADAYLAVLAAEQTIFATQAGVTRATEFETVIGALTRAELRPGADLSRMQAEVVLQQTAVVRAQQAAAQARALLAQYTGEPAAIPLQSDLTVREITPSAPAGVIASHPYLRERQLSIEEIIARMKVLDRSWYPRLQTQAAAFGRGTGARVNGPFAGGANGLYPDHGNWAIGFSATFAILDYKVLRARKEIELQRQRTEEARRALTERELNGRLAQAQAQWEGARRIAALAPQQQTFLRSALEQAGARYRTGLGTLIEVSDAQRQLTQADVEVALARLAVWRAELALAYAQGDLAPFLARIP